MSHLLLTNDYPPKVGGIQTYLWELWRRLPLDSFEVFTSPHEDARRFDSGQNHRIHRYDHFWLPPSRRVASGARRLIGDGGHASVVIDPAWPLGFVGPRLGVPYAVVLHGAEVNVPSRLPVARTMLRRAVAGADLVISASHWATSTAAAIVGDMPPSVYVPPGVDTGRFSPLSPAQRQATRRRLGFDPKAPLIVGVSRLVPRKGFDVLIDAAAAIADRHPGLQVVIAGTGRDERRLRERIVRAGSPAQLLGFVPDSDLPSLYGCADGFVMLCRERWRGLEQEGFGIVFVEAAAAGCPQIAGRSGGSAEAIAHGETGWIVDDPTDVASVASVLNDLLARRHDDAAMRAACRAHAEEHFAYDLLAERLRVAIGGLGPSNP
ncbi:MAG: glycosyltransferase family 4 protein [Actinomycetota bacterium]